MAKLAEDTFLVQPYTEEDTLSYTDVQNHPGNGAALVDNGTTRTIGNATRFSVARTRRGYCTVTPASEVYSVTPGMRQAYGAKNGTSGTVPDIDRGPYSFSTDS